MWWIVAAVVLGGTAVALQAPVARLPLARAMEYVPSLQAAANAIATTFEGGDD